MPVMKHEVWGFGWPNAYAHDVLHGGSGTDDSPRVEDLHHRNHREQVELGHAPEGGCCALSGLHHKIAARSGLPTPRSGPSGASFGMSRKKRRLVTKPAARRTPPVAPAANVENPVNPIVEPMEMETVTPVSEAPLLEAPFPAAVPDETVLAEVRPPDAPVIPAPAVHAPVPEAEPEAPPLQTAEATPTTVRVGGHATPVRLGVRRRSTLRRVLAAFTTSTALLAVAVAVAAASMVPPIGARRSARQAAETEARAQLASDEQIVASTFASQRRWTDMWRESFGLVVATSRRVLYVGAPATPLLRPREDGPLELLVESYPYEASFIIEPRRVFFGRLRGLALRTPLARVDFLISPDEWNGAEAVARAAVASQRRMTEEQETLERFNRAPLPAADVYVPYIVKRGETLTGLARRFHTSADVLRQLNQLHTDDIKAGQRLRVPEISAGTPRDSLR